MQYMYMYVLYSILSSMAFAIRNHISYFYFNLLEYKEEFVSVTFLVRYLVHVHLKIIASSHKNTTCLSKSVIGL